MLTLIGKLKYYSYHKILCALLILATYCFLLTNQQFNFGEFRPDFPNYNFGSNLQNRNWLSPGQELIFGRSTSRPQSPSDNIVIVNNSPTSPTMVPFIPQATTPTPQFLNCLERCPTTSEHNPICASNRQLYGNEQKFNCARLCGADIQIVRRGSCEGLFPMSRG